MIEHYLTLARSSLGEVIKKAIFDVYNDDFTESQKVFTRISKRIPSDDEVLTEYADAIKNKCSFITIKDKCYPEKLKQISSAPIILSVKGNKNILRNNIVAVVGTREPEQDDFSSIRNIVKTICECGFVVSSGLAKGTDCIAHIQSVKTGTTATMAHGLNMCYPKEHQLLLDKIIENNGAVISEYGFHQPPNKQNFAKRNRIIVGMSNSTIIMRARKSISGTMISAKYAKEFGRHIYTINPCGENEGNVYLLQSKMATQIENLETFRYQLMMDCLNKENDSPEQKHTSVSSLYQNNNEIINDIEIIRKELPSMLTSLKIQNINENNFSKALSFCKKNTNFSDKCIKQFLLEKLIDNKKD